MLYYINMGIKGYEKLSLVDYDLKLSATIFFGGCNFRCPFCHNKDLLNDEIKTEIVEEDEVFKYLKKRQHLFNQQFQKEIAEAE